MSRRRLRRRSEKAQRHTHAPLKPAAPPPRRPRGERVERLAYTRQQAAKAIGVSLATLDRRVVPAIETVADGMGRTADPSRRARALPRRAKASGRSPPSDAARSKAGSAARSGHSDPPKTRPRREPGRDRAPAQHRTGPDRAGRAPVVAVDGARRPRPLCSIQSRPSARIGVPAVLDRGAVEDRRALPPGREHSEVHLRLAGYPGG